MSIVKNGVKNIALVGYQLNINDFFVEMTKLIIVIFIIILVSFTNCYNDIFNKYFVSYQEALQEGYVKNGGWLPEFLPSTSKNIFLQFNIDTNNMSMRFNIPDSSKNELLNKLKKITKEEKLFYYPAVSVNWWDNEIKKAFLNRERNNNKYNFYKYEKKIIFADNHYEIYVYIVAINRFNSNIFIWGYLK